MILLWLESFRIYVYHLYPETIESYPVNALFAPFTASSLYRRFKFLGSAGTPLKGSRFLIHTHAEVFSLPALRAFPIKCKLQGARVSELSPVKLVQVNAQAGMSKLRIVYSHPIVRSPVQASRRVCLYAKWLSRMKLPQFLLEGPYLQIGRDGVIYDAR